MKYMTVWTVSQENDAAARKRFGEPEPTDGIKVLGRWNECGTGKGYTLIETDDVVALSRLNLHWADLVDMKIVPVVDDEEIAKALGG